MPSIDLDSINFETGSWEIPPDQAAKLQAIADGLNRAITANPRAVFLIEGHTDAVGSDVDNLSLSDRRAEFGGGLLTQQFERAGGKPDLARLWRAVSERGDGRAEPRQPPRHHPQHHAAAERRTGFAAAPAARHRAAALRSSAFAMKMAGRNPGHFLFAIQALSARGGRQASQIAAT